MAKDSDESAGRVLLVEDTLALARTYLGYLRDDPYSVDHVETAAAARAAFSPGAYDAVLLDLKLPDGDGMDVLRHMREIDPRLRVIVITAHGSVVTAVAAMREGAADFIVKPFGGDRLRDALARQIDQRKLARDLETLAETGAPPPGLDAPLKSFHGFIGASAPMQLAYRALSQAARSSATVFITGESGVGKEVAAQALHAESPRAGAPFIALNCAAIPGELMESEIFGHVRGAFTGAAADKPGAAKAADGGTLFLDEVCEMSPHLQSKLLRFVQTGAFNPVGSTKLEKVDVRFVCATNRDPLTEIEAGRFREDLYYRLHVIPVTLPPLRERGDDVLALARDLLRRYAAEEGKAFADLAPDAAAALSGYRWPGNVRQLQNVLRNAVVLNDGALLTAEMLPAPVGDDGGGGRARAASTPAAAPPASPSPSPHDLAALSQAIRPLAEIEREAIERAVTLCAGDVRKAAVFLGVSAATIYRKQKAWRGEE